VGGAYLGAPSAALSGGILGDGMEARLRAELLTERAERSAMAERLRTQVSLTLPRTEP